MPNIVSTSYDLQHALAVRVCNQRGRSCHSLAHPILGSHQMRQLGELEGGAGRGCIVPGGPIGLNMERALITCAQGKRK